MNGRVVNTCNLSETMIGWETRWGDAVGDFSPFADLTATEVIEIGKLCNIPIELVVKKPADGLCGKTDEDAFGFTYYQLDQYLRTGETTATALQKIQKKESGSTFKRREIPKYHSGITNFGKW
jgi:NAD+ synthase